MKIALNISKHDGIGRRFNNLDVRDGFAPHGWQAKFACWTTPTESPDFVQQANPSGSRALTKFLGKLGRYTGNINGLYRNSSAFTRLPFYKESDLLHFHIVHEEYLSVKDWLKLADGKPVVWTWHDPYMLSGHCIYSMDCNGFEYGCFKCPHLDYHFSVKRDRAFKNLQEKVSAVKAIDPLVIVASDYMQDLIQRSAYKDFLRVKILPFGLKTLSIKDSAQLKNFFGIPMKNIVVGFRAVYSDYKGLNLILRALKDFSKKFPSFPLTIITFQEKGLLDELSSFYQVIDAGWVEGDLIHDYYTVMDFFLMPSRAEAFGLMAIEAMAAGACPIVTYGTALPDLVDAPIRSICVPHNEFDYSRAFEAAVFDYQCYRVERERRQRYAKEWFDEKSYCARLAELYEEEYERFNSI